MDNQSILFIHIVIVAKLGLGWAALVIANVVEEKYAGYSNEAIEEIRLIALLTKGGHSLAKVENRMKILAHYVNNNDITETSVINPIET